MDLTPPIRGNWNQPLDDKHQIKNKVLPSIEHFINEQYEIDSFNAKKSGQRPPRRDADVYRQLGQALTWHRKNAITLTKQAGQRRASQVKELSSKKPKFWQTDEMRKRDIPPEKIGHFMTSIWVYPQGEVEVLMKFLEPVKKIKTDAQDERAMSVEVAGDD